MIMHADYAVSPQILPWHGGGLAGTFLDWAGHPVTCPGNQVYSAGACINDCSGIADVNTQWACVQQNNAIWAANATAQGQAPGQLTDPSTGLPVSLPGYSPTQMLTGIASKVTPVIPPKGTPPAPPPTTATCPSGFTLEANTCVVVNPSPPNQPTSTQTTGQNPNSAVSTANGTTTPAGNLAGTVQGFVSTLTSSTDIIPGIPNWLLLTGGVLGIAYVLQSGKK